MEKEHQRQKRNKQTDAESLWRKTMCVIQYLAVMANLGPKTLVLSVRGPTGSAARFCNSEHHPNEFELTASKAVSAAPMADNMSSQKAGTSIFLATSAFFGCWLWCHTSHTVWPLLNELCVSMSTRILSVCIKDTSKDLVCCEHLALAGS